MAPITPSGTRFLLRCKPLGSVRSSITSPTGSGRAATVLTSLAIPSSRLEGIANDVRTVAALPDPVGEVIEERTLPNGLHLSKKRVPLGVIGAIYESRPNVTVDISVLCLKSGNAIILRGGKEALRSN